eukprot:scaffold143975_cov35-Prasinocladus_malaysianus.AAC.1
MCRPAHVGRDRGQGQRQGAVQAAALPYFQVWRRQDQPRQVRTLSGQTCHHMLQENSGFLTEVVAITLLFLMSLRR